MKNQKEKAIQNALKIEGYYQEEELTFLYDIVQKYKNNGIVVEIGSLKGRSTSILCEACNGGKFKRELNKFNEKIVKNELDQEIEKKTWAFYYSKLKKINYVISIDLHFHPISSNMIKVRGDTWKEINKLCFSYPNLISIFGPSNYIVNLLDKKVSIIHFNGSHQFDHIAEDIQIWWDKIQENGILIFHDYGIIREDIHVQIVVDLLLKKNQCDIIGSSGKTIAIKKKVKILKKNWWLNGT